MVPASFEGSSSWASPSSRHNCAAAGFSVKNESGPRSSTAPSTISELKHPPSRSRASNSVYSTAPPDARAFSSSKAAASPAIPPPMTAIRIVEPVSLLEQFRAEGYSRRQTQDQRRRVFIARTIDSNGRKPAPVRVLRRIGRDVEHLFEADGTRSETM